MSGFTYILTSNSGTLYTGSTNNLFRRVLEHRAAIHSRFAAKYHCKRLVWFEQCETPQAAIAREKQIKGWARARKIALVESVNPEWRDLAAHWGQQVRSRNIALVER